MELPTPSWLPHLEPGGLASAYRTNAGRTRNREGHGAGCNRERDRYHVGALMIYTSQRPQLVGVAPDEDVADAVQPGETSEPDAPLHTREHRRHGSRGGFHMVRREEIKGRLSRSSWHHIVARISGRQPTRRSSLDTARVARYGGKRGSLTELAGSAARICPQRSTTRPAYRRNSGEMAVGIPSYLESC